MRRCNARCILTTRMGPLVDTRHCYARGWHVNTKNTWMIAVACGAPLPATGGIWGLLRAMPLQVMVPVMVRRGGRGTGTMLIPHETMVLAPRAGDLQTHATQQGLVFFILILFRPNFGRKINNQSLLLPPPPRPVYIAIEVDFF
jgi:hypothetical protein